MSEWLHGGAVDSHGYFLSCTSAPVGFLQIFQFPPTACYTHVNTNVSLGVGVLMVVCLVCLYVVLIQNVPHFLHSDLW